MEADVTSEKIILDINIIGLNMKSLTCFIQNPMPGGWWPIAGSGGGCPKK